MTQQNNEAFEKWLEREMPAGTVIGNPAWWAKRIAQRAKADSEREIAELKEKLQTELKRVSSYKNLVTSLEGQVSHYSQKDYSLSKPRLDGLEQSLASEQEMNEVLTNENTELQAHINVLREALEEANALNINWSSEAEPHTLEYFSEYRAVIKMGTKALASTPEMKDGKS